MPRGARGQAMQTSCACAREIANGFARDLEAAARHGSELQKRMSMPGPLRSHRALHRSSRTIAAWLKACGVRSTGLSNAAIGGTSGRSLSRVCGRERRRSRARGGPPGPPRETPLPPPKVSAAMPLPAGQVARSRAAEEQRGVEQLFERMNRNDAGFAGDRRQDASFAGESPVWAAAARALARVSPPFRTTTGFAAAAPLRARPGNGAIAHPFQIGCDHLRMRIARPMREGSRPRSDGLVAAADHVAEAEAGLLRERLRHGSGAAALADHRDIAANERVGFGEKRGEARGDGTAVSMMPMQFGPASINPVSGRSGELLLQLLRRARRSRQNRRPRRSRCEFRPGHIPERARELTPLPLRKSRGPLSREDRSLGHGRRARPPRSGVD